MRELVVASYGVELIYILALGVWLFWTGAGAVLGKRGYVPDISVIVFSFFALGILFPLETTAIRAIRLLPGAVAGSYLPLMVQVLAVLLCLMPAGIMLGLLFQWTAGYYVRSADKAGDKRNFALAYAWESAGAVLGGLAATLLLMRGASNFTQALLCAFVSTLATLVPGSGGGKVTRFFGAFFLFALFGAFWFSTPADRFMTRWSHPDLVESMDTPYGRITVTESGGRFAVFDNDALAFDTESVSAEQFVHLAALQYPNPRRVLISGGGVEGLVREALKYGPLKIDFVELDRGLINLTRSYLPGEFTGFLRSDVVKVHESDPRAFLKHSEEIYDLMLVGMPEPSSGQSNRYFTREYFELCEKKLSSGGVLALRVSSSENIWTPFMAYRNAGVYKALSAVFKDVAVLPGTTNILIASKDRIVRDPEILKTRFMNGNISSKSVTPPYIEYVYTNDRFFEIEKTFSESAALPNTDLAPTCYRYTTMIWLSKFAPEMIHWDISSMTPLRLFFGTLLFLTALIICTLLTIASAKKMRRGVVLVFAAAFIGMAMEIMLLLFYQIKQGVLYQNIGLLLMVFMAGMTVGTLLVEKYGQNGNGPMITHSTPALFAQFVLLNAIFITIVRFETDAGLFVVSVLLFAGGFFVSSVLAKESLNVDYDQRKVVSPFYAADLAGGCAGSLLASLWLIPFLGIGLTAGTVALLSAALYFLSRIKRPGYEA